MTLQRLFRVRSNPHTLCLCIVGAGLFGTYLGKVYRRAQVTSAIALRVESLGGRVMFDYQVIENAPRVANEEGLRTPFSAYLLGKEATKSICSIELKHCEST